MTYTVKFDYVEKDGNKTESFRYEGLKRSEVFKYVGLVIVGLRSKEYFEITLYKEVSYLAPVGYLDKADDKNGDIMEMIRERI